MELFVAGWKKLKTFGDVDSMGDCFIPDRLPPPLLGVFTLELPEYIIGEELLLY